MSTLRIHIRRKDYVTAEAKRLPALRDFRLDVQAGQFVCLVGPSGCGKTTLLNLLAGLDRQFEGSIDLGNELARRRIGYVFQNPRLLPWRTVRENIDLACPAGSDSAYVDHLFKVVGLPDAGALYPEQLSIGMSRRVALVRAFAVNPALLLMDEPFVSLDPPTARRVRELLMTLWLERPHTVLFVTHDLREAIELADRLVFLSPSPASVVCDLPVPLNRAERTESAIDEFRRHLYADRPEIRSLL